MIFCWLTSFSGTERVTENRLFLYREEEKLLHKYHSNEGDQAIRWPAMFEGVAGA